MATLVTRGVLAVLSDSSVEFAAPVLRSVYIQELFRSTAPSQLVSSLDDFIIQCLGALNAENFMRSFSRHSAGQPVYEALWQKVFYKVNLLLFSFFCSTHQITQAATTVLGQGSDVSPEIGNFFGSDGKLDFYIDSNKQWGIELLREGDRLTKHLARFEPGGEYENIKLRAYVIQCSYFVLIWLPSSKAVIDFRRENKTPPTVTNDDLWCVVYADDYKTGTIYRKGQLPYPIRFLGGTVG